MKYALGVDLRKDRIAAIQLTSLTLRCMENWSRHAGGYDEAMILVAIVAITSEKFTRATLPDDLQSLAQPMPKEDLAECNISSIAAATGLNRETARRKVNALIERGMLVKVDKEGVRFSAGLLQAEGTRDLIKSQVEAFRRTAETLLAEGVLTITSKRERSSERTPAN